MSRFEIVRDDDGQPVELVALDRETLTEAEHAAWATGRIADAASQISKLLPAGLSLEVAATPPITMDGMRQLMEQLGPPRPPRTLKMHPAAFRILHAAPTWAASKSPIDGIALLTGIPIIEDDTMADRAWELLEGDHVIDSGVLGQA